MTSLEYLRQSDLEGAQIAGSDREEIELKIWSQRLQRLNGGLAYQT